jgi:hypothetical protein
MTTIERKNTDFHQIKDRDYSEPGCGSGSNAFALPRQNMVLSSSLKGILLTQEEKEFDFLTRRNLNSPADKSLEKKRHSTKEKGRRDLFNMKQSFKTDDTAPHTSRVMKILLLAFLQSVDTKDTKSSSCYHADIIKNDDDESLIDDYDDELQDSIHLAKQRYGRPDSEASWAATRRRGNFKMIGDSVDARAVVSSFEPDSTARSTKGAKAA